MIASGTAKFIHASLPNIYFYKLADVVTTHRSNAAGRLITMLAAGNMLAPISHYSAPCFFPLSLYCAIYSQEFAIDQFHWLWLQHRKLKQQEAKPGTKIIALY